MPRRLAAAASFAALAAVLIVHGGCGSSRKTGPPSATPTVTPTLAPCVTTPVCPTSACTGTPPSLSPTAVATAALSISELYTDGAGTQWIEIWNRGSSAVPMTGYWLCFFPDYWPFPSGFSLAAGARVVVHWSAAGTDSATDLYTGVGSLPSFVVAGGEIGLYVCSTFGSGSCIVDYLEWGGSGHPREPAAVAAGIWSVDATPTLSGGQSLTLDPATAGNRGCHYVLCTPSPGC